MSNTSGGSDITKIQINAREPSRDPYANANCVHIVLRTVDIAR